MQGITNGLSASIHYNPRGQWVSGNNYSIDDWLYDDKGQYICIAPISASTTAPSQDTTHFKKTAVVQTTSGTITQGDFLTIDENGNIVDSLKNADDFLEEDDLPTHLPQTAENTLYDIRVAIADEYKPNFIEGRTISIRAKGSGVPTSEQFFGARGLYGYEGGIDVLLSDTYLPITFVFDGYNNLGYAVWHCTINNVEYAFACTQTGAIRTWSGSNSISVTSIQPASALYRYGDISPTGFTPYSDVIIETNNSDTTLSAESISNRTIRIKGSVQQGIYISYKVKQSNSTGQVTLINHYTPAIEVNPTSAVDDTLNKIKINGVTYQFAFADPHKAKIYGVTGLNQSDPTLTRTDDAVGLTYTATGSSNSVVSDFDNCYPWSDMRLVTDSEGNSFIRVPKFYHKMETNNGIITWKISGVRYAGYSTYFTNGNTEVDFIDIGCYEGSVANSKLCSKPNVSVTASQTIATFRTQALANGTGYHLYDFKSDIILKALFTIEFATTNSQSIFMGNTSTSAGQSTGTTDDNMAKSGVANANTLQSSVSFKYRGIENLFGNCWKFVDGIGFYDSNIYLCLDPTKYANIADYQNLPTGYRLVGTRGMTNGYAKTMGLLADNGYLYTSDVGGSTTTYYSDYYYQATSYRLLLVGGAWGDGANAGMWYWNGIADWSYSNSYIGARLCKTPV